MIQSPAKTRPDAHYHGHQVSSWLAKRGEAGRHVRSVVSGGSSSKERYSDPPSSSRHQKRSETLIAKNWGGGALNSGRSLAACPAEFPRKSCRLSAEIPPKASGVPGPN